MNEEVVEYIDAEFPSIGSATNRYLYDWSTIRDLDTITEVSETSCSTALRSLNGEYISSIFKSERPPNDGHFTKTEREVKWMSASCVNMLSETQKNVSTDSVGQWCPQALTGDIDQNRRFLSAYQQYHRVENQPHGSPESTVSISSSAPTVAIASDEKNSKYPNQSCCFPCPFLAQDNDRFITRRRIINMDSSEATAVECICPKSTNGDGTGPKMRVQWMCEWPNNARRGTCSPNLKNETVTHSEFRLSSSSSASLPKEGRSDAPDCGSFLLFTDPDRRWTIRSPSCVASATSQAILNDPTLSPSSAPKSAYFSSLAYRKILAEASAQVEDQNPYLALARAAVGAASKAASASRENLDDNDPGFGTVSLIVSSSVTTTKGNLLKSTTKSTPDFISSFGKDSRRTGEEMFGKGENYTADWDMTVRSAHSSIWNQPALHVYGGWNGSETNSDTWETIRETRPITDQTFNGQVDTQLNADKLRTLLRPPYYASALGCDASDELDETPSQPLNETDSSTIMNETLISTKSNDSTSTRPSSRSSWRLWDSKLFRNDQTRRDADSEIESKTNRRNKYKTKIENAKKSYFQQQSQRPASAYSCLDDSEKKPVITRLPEPPPLTNFEKVSPHRFPITNQEMKFYPPTPKFDSEYEYIVKRAEQNWSSYKRRLDDKNRALSTGVLEHAENDQCVMRKSIRETDLDQAQIDIERESRKKSKENHPPMNGHRAKSADFATDQKFKSELEPPENELRKLILDRSENEEKNLSKHELRFRKSIEKLHVPDWYLHSQYFARSHSPSKSKRGIGRAQAEGPKEYLRSEKSIDQNNFEHGREFRQPSAFKRWTKSDSNCQKSIDNRNQHHYGRIWETDQTKYRDNRNEMRKSDHSGLRMADDFHLPKDFFKKYKEEIEEMRKSRSNLSRSDEYRLSTDQGASDQHGQRRPVPIATVRPTQIYDGYEEISGSFTPIKENDGRESILEKADQSMHRGIDKRRSYRVMEGWTVSKVADSGSLSKVQEKVVIEVVSEVEACLQSVYQKQPVRMSLAEVLDSLVACDQENSNWIPASEKGVDQSSPAHVTKLTKTGIFSKNITLMEKCAASPHLAQHLLKNEPLWMQCSYCQIVRLLPNRHYQNFTLATCRYCYTYYCNLACHKSDFHNHISNICDYARVNSLCQKVIAKIRQDPESIYRMSLMGRAHFSVNGPGAVDFQLSNPDVGKSFIEKGWRAFDNIGGQLGDHLHYYPLDKLIDNCKAPNLISLCRSYNHHTSFVLKLSVVVEPLENALLMTLPDRKIKINAPLIKIAEQPNKPGDQSAHIDYIDDRSKISAPIDALPISGKLSIKQQPPTLPKKAPRKSVIKSMFRLSGGNDQASLHQSGIDRSGKVRNEKTWVHEKISFSRSSQL